MAQAALAGLRAEIAGLSAAHPVGRVISVTGGLLRVSGLSRAARLGDRVQLQGARGPLAGEVVAIRNYPGYCAPPLTAALRPLPTHACDG